MRALVDTGCSETSINLAVAEECRLSIVAKARARTSGGMIDTNAYHGDLVFRDQGTFHDRWFVGLTHPHPSFEALLGMDVLTRGRLLVDGPGRIARFDW
jgi:hypothetical protein